MSQKQSLQAQLREELFSIMCAVVAEHSQATRDLEKVNVDK